MTSEIRGQAAQLGFYPANPEIRPVFLDTGVSGERDHRSQQV